MRKLLIQILKFCAVGIICFFIDFICLTIFTDIFKINYLISSALSFSISVTVNYILSIKYVFYKVNGKRKKRDFVFYVLFSILGLFFTELIMKIGVDNFSFDYRNVKIIATFIVTTYNFLTRKFFFERNN